MRSIDKTNSRTFGRRAFTLAELLIVVAIIAVLVGVSIPIFTSQLEKSREATDIANMRSAKSAIIELYYAGITDDPKGAASYGLFWYNQGKTLPMRTSRVFTMPPQVNLLSADGYDNLRKKLTPYGQGTPNDAGTDFLGYNGTLDYTDSVITVTIYPNGLESLQNCPR